jgi:hypothetical protein
LLLVFWHPAVGRKLPWSAEAKSPDGLWLATARSDAIRYWEVRRIVYNLILAAVVAVWVVATWPHLRETFVWPAILSFVVLAALANVLYSAAYCADVFVQYSSFRDLWRRRPPLLGAPPHPLQSLAHSRCHRLDCRHVPHVRPAFAWPYFVALLILAMFANLCYCAAYVADLPMQYSSFRQLWRHRRGALFATGTLFAIILANYWIVDEIYSYVPYVR